MAGIYYHLSEYISHKIAGKANMKALQMAGARLVPAVSEADVVVLHDDPLNWGALATRLQLAPFTARGGTVVGYGVWETETLPKQYREQLQHVHRVWTCSDFSAQAFAPHCKVDVVPHPAEKRTPPPEAMEAVRKRIRYTEGRFYFYTIVDSVNPRKNLKLLLETYTQHFSRRDDVRLVVKQYRHPWDLSNLPGIISIEEELPSEELAALHALCHCCVSPHHAEAWGLSLSEAMAAGTPVIATGWSGNMHFMTQANSYPVRYTLDAVSAEMCSRIPLYTREMQWAVPDPGHLAHLMRKVLRYWEKGETPPVCTQAMEDMRAYAPDNIGKKICSLLNF